MTGTESTSLVCGLDLGGTKLLGVIVDPAGTEPLASAKVPTPRGAEGVINAMVDLASTLADQVQAAGHGQMRALGVGAPGLVDRSGTFRYGPNLPDVVDVPLADVLSARLGVPVVVDNDATCAGWAEHERGASRGANHSLLFTLGTGIGGGMTVKGEVLRGAHGFAGEPGHMVVDPSGPPCPCGRRGCWERYASGTGLGRLGREAAAAGRLTAVLAKVGGDAVLIDGLVVTQAALAGDPEALAVMHTFADWLAFGIANILNVVDSEIVVLGGGLVAAGHLFLDPVRAGVRDLVMGSAHRPEVPIVAAELGERAGAWGAALLAATRT